MEDAEDRRNTPLRTPNGGIMDDEEARSFMSAAQSGMPEVREYRPGDLIADRYEVEKVFSGGMGYVYIARQKRQDLRFAIKQPNAMVLSRPEFFARVVKEAGAWTRLGMHPNVAYCYFVRQIDRVPYIFVEYVEGGTLRDWIENGRCADFQVGLRLAVEFCHGMEFAHAKGMIHRDVKPENVLMTRKGSAKVTDFGLVGGTVATGDPDTVDPNGNRTLMGAVMGTPPYMSPEQWADPRQKSGEVPEGVWFDSDVFSFGACLWEMFCGGRPYKNTRKLEGEPPDPVRLRHDMPAELARILKRCVHPDRGKRPADFTELRTALNEAHRAVYGKDVPGFQLKLVDTAADELNNQGYSYYELGQAKKAVASFRQALARDPSHPHATYNLSLMEYFAGQIDDEQVLKKLKNCAGNPHNRGVIEELIAYIHAQRSDPEQAWEALRGISGKYEAVFSGRKPSRTGVLRNLPGHRLQVKSVDITPDGRFGISGGHGNEIRHWDMVAGACLAVLDAHSQGVNQVALSEDHGIAVTASPDGTSKVFDLANHRETGILKEHSLGVTCAATTADGKWALTGSVDRTLRLWDLSARRCAATLNCHDSAVTALSMTPDGRFALAVGSDGAMDYISISGREVIRTLRSERGPVKCAAMSADGSRAITGSGNGLVQVWDLRSGECVASRTAHVGDVTAVALVRDGRYGISAGAGGAVRLWELSSLRCIRTLRETEGAVSAVALSEDGAFAVFGGPGSAVSYWELSFEPTFQAELALSRFTRYDFKIIEQTLKKNTLDQARLLFDRGHGPQAYDLLLSAWKKTNFVDDRNFLALYSDMVEKGKLKNVHSVPHAMALSGHTGPVHQVTMTADLRYVLTAGDDRTIRRWSVESGRCLHTLRGHRDAVHALAISPGGRHILSGGADTTLKYWDMSSGQCLLTLVGHRTPVLSVAFAGAGRYVLSGSENFVKVWDVSSGQCVRTMPGHHAGCIAITAGGKQAIWGHGAHSLALWDLSTGNRISLLDGHDALHTCVAVSRDGNFAVTGDKSGTVKYWLVRTGHCLSTLPMHKGAVRSIGLSVCGRFGYSCGDDGMVKVWELPTARTGQNLQGHDKQALSVFMSPNSRYLVSGGAGGSVVLRRLVWNIEFLGRKTRRRKGGG